MKTHHPTGELLSLFAAGEIEPQLAVLVSAHVGECDRCARKVADLEDKLAQNFMEGDSPPVDFSGMMEEIFHAPPQRLQSAAEKHRRILNFRGREITLPAALRPLTAQMSEWKTGPGKISYAKVDLPGSGIMYFIHFGQGASIPEHTHLGREYSYVVAGRFRDEKREFNTGDFAFFDGADTHSPSTDDPDGCVLLAVVDAPFRFTEGWSRLMNPLGRWFFARSRRR